jgi:hypothetical protein
VGYAPSPSESLKGPNALDFLHSIARPAAIASAALCLMHPEQYSEGLKNMSALQDRALSGELPIWHILEHWASVFTALSLISNRETPYHRDPLSRAQWFDILTSTGCYPSVRMSLPSLGMEVEYAPGVMLGMSGRMVRHGVRRVDGDRICVAWYMRESVHKYTGIERGEWSIGI